MASSNDGGSSSSGNGDGGGAAADCGMADSPVPEGWIPRLRAYELGAFEPVAPRHAATVVLLRDRPSGMEAYLLRRAATMAFAAGFHAFPGGSLDPRDADAALGWVGPAPAVWGERFGCDEGHARALLCAAVRETFEESGVLLAGPDADGVVGDTTGAAWEADRRGLIARTWSLAQLLERRGLVLRADLLGGWSRWITPAFEERRYDTAFFVAALPSGQRARDVSGEADQVAWLRPGDAAAGSEAGRLAMLPPTLATLRGVGAHPDAQAVLRAAATRPISPITPEVRQDADGSWRMRWPR
jgi:8-oxo-dGTP pyrophosphatase MutT (NUDIX family)